MKKVYVLTSGVYSDHKIEGIFSTRKLAEEYKNIVVGKDYNDVEEWGLDPNTASLIKRGYTVWHVLMLRSGDVERICQIDGFGHETTFYYLWERTKVPAYVGKNVPDVLTASVLARNEKHAIKIVNEIRAQMIAGNEWPQGAL